MAKQTKNKGNGSDHESQTALIVNSQYIKDFSFENPSPRKHIMNTQERPSISVHIEAQADKVEERTFEVVLHVNVDAKHKDEQVFLLDLQYGGTFTIGQDVPEEFVRPILMIECPRILFPFLRNLVAIATQEGGYPPLLLTPVDFADLYQRQVEQENAQKEKSKGKELLQ